ncbi:Zn finger [Haloarcula tailed virus 2]|uniref:Zn finger n=1 Tax=Haloarcula tailed virus 2 TaxID=2877989 RepID=A0AAE9BYL9_9CAUD|nr:Zn finger [Haloarcula tailed virus 2]UBF23273.1 Zn finger [Haloarcula tailed virus 2]
MNDRKRVCKACNAAYTRKVRIADIEVHQCEDCGHEEIA